MWEIEQKYKSDFDELVETTIAAHHKLPIDLIKPHLLYLYKCLCILDNTFTYTRDDIIQQLRLIWFELFNKYNKTKPKIHIRQYLIRCSVWAIRDWMIKDMSIVSSFKVKDAEDHFSLSEPEFKLDLHFLFYGSDYELIKHLSPYHRYLLYLIYTKDQSILEVASKIQKDRSIVSKDFKVLLQKLKERINVY